jgi:hypothetical protein
MRRLPCGIWPAALIVGLLALAARPAAAAEKYSYADLVHQLNDLQRLATLPAEGDTCRQHSSWDRASKYDAKTGKYVAWDANGDGGGIIRQEGKQAVFAEMEGPGCIWRIWSALPEKGHVKIYLDGSDTPAVDLAFADYFDGKHAPFNYPMLSYRLEDVGSRGQNLYFPIPYQKSCKIVADEKWGAYYHFNYETFPKGTQVPTFSAKLAEDNAAALREVNDYFAKRMGTDPAGKRETSYTLPASADIPAGSYADLPPLPGPGAITAIRISGEFKDRQDQIDALRRVSIEIRWDGQKEPAVWCPLGDFFGTAPGVNLYKSLPTGMTKDGFYSLWYMPYGKEARIRLVNEDKVERDLAVTISHTKLKQFEGLGYFHCKWHRDVFPLSKDRWPDWTVLRTEGRGRFCGMTLHVWNPRGGWWGEGDEKWFVDGEKFPSTFGTGAEDYFGYAWGDPHLFQKPFHCQTMTQNNSGHQSLLRWHIVDNVPFQTGFEGVLEKYFLNDRCLFACTAVWYLAPGGKDPFGAVPVADREGYWVNMPLVAGGFKVLGTPPGNLETQGLADHGKSKWDNDDQLWWTGAKVGDKLEIALPVKEAGTYRLSAVMTKAKDYGIVQVYLDGKKAGDRIDLYNDGVIPTDPPVALGSHKLEAGEHKLTVEIVGKNEKAIPGYMFGLDRLILEK